MSYKDIADKLALASYKWNTSEECWKFQIKEDLGLPRRIWMISTTLAGFGEVEGTEIIALCDWANLEEPSDD